MGNFWTGFEKKAADAAAEPAPVEELPAAAAPLPHNALSQPPQRLLKWDSQGGVAPRYPEDAAAAQAVDLVTLPQDVEGANCGNCQFFRPMDEATGAGFCTNPDVKQDVTARMCCARWDSPGTLRGFEAEDPSAVPNAQVLQEVDDEQAQQAMGGMPPEAGQDPLAAGAPAEGTPPAEQVPGEMKDQKPEADQDISEAKEKPAPKKEKKPEKKDAPGGANTININVGHSKKAELSTVAPNLVKRVLERFRQTSGRMTRGARPWGPK